MPHPSSSLHPLPRQTKPAARPASPSKPRRRRSLIASLPKSVRDQINGFLREGLTYAQVIARLGDSGKLLNTDHIEHWFAGGYQDWLKEQHWLEQMRQKLDFACDILKDTEAGKIHEASLRIVVKQMYDLLSDFDPASFIEQLAEDPASYARILNALSKLTEAAIKYHRQQAEEAHRKAMLDKDGAKARGLTERTRRQIEEEFNLV